jgi:single-strand DNA-binding protein
MLALRNHVTLVGDIASAAKITCFENGNKVARFNLATEKEVRTNSGKIKPMKEWHRLFAWGNLADFIETYGEKGKKIAIHGKLVKRTYLNPEGVQRNITEVEIQHIIGI